MKWVPGMASQRAGRIDQSASALLSGETVLEIDERAASIRAQYRHVFHSRRRRFCEHLVKSASARVRSILRLRQTPSDAVGMTLETHGPLELAVL